MASNKRKLHHLLVLLRPINSFLLLGLCIASALTTVLALRSNNQEMVKLRAAVFAADKANTNIEGSLKDLRSYVYKHMNTNLASGANAVKPPIQLKYEYERLNAANVTAYQTASAKMLEDAQNTCVAQYPGTVFSQSRLDCAKAYAAAHPIAQKTIPEDLYKFDFLSTSWSPDLAGYTLLATGLFLFLFLIRVLSSWAIKRELSNNA